MTDVMSHMLVSGVMCDVVVSVVTEDYQIITADVLSSLFSSPLFSILFFFKGFLGAHGHHICCLCFGVCGPVVGSLLCGQVSKSA